MQGRWMKNRRRVESVSQCSGQAAVETIFAMVVLVLLILVTAQLFFLSEKAIYLMAAVHKTTRERVHELDVKKFQEIELSEDGLVQTLPGMQWALEYLGASKVQDSFEIRRRLFVFGGAYQGKGESIFVQRHRGPPPCPEGLKVGGKGQRELDIRSAL